MLDQHILAGHAKIGSTVLHIGRHIRGPHNDQSHIGAIGADDQLARGLRVLGRPDASRRQ